MKFSCQGLELADAVLKVVKAAAVRTTNPILECVKMVAEDENKDVIDTLIEVYNSFISPKLDDYNSSVYYENANYIFECYKEKKML